MLLSLNAVSYGKSQARREAAGAVSILEDQPSSSMSTPQVRMQQRSRMEQMIDMYGGERARRLITTQTRIDMHFDALVDQHGAPLWPNIPLRL